VRLSSGPGSMLSRCHTTVLINTGVCTTCCVGSNNNNNSIIINNINNKTFE